MGIYTEAYISYLQSPEWQLKRAEAFRFHGHACFACKKLSPLHIHHITYARLGHEDVSTDLIPLCAKCHKKLHKLARRRKLAVETATQAYLLVFDKHTNPPKKERKKKRHRHHVPKSKPVSNTPEQLDAWKRALIERDINRNKSPEEMREIVKARVAMRRAEREAKSVAKRMRRLETGVYEHRQSIRSTKRRERILKKGAVRRFQRERHALKMAKASALSA